MIVVSRLERLPTLGRIWSGEWFGLESAAREGTYPPKVGVIERTRVPSRWHPTRHHPNVPLPAPIGFGPLGRPATYHRRIECPATTGTEHI